jgi:diaminohydroxyphosphoribosylaminopyrimidine deaminase / 5-amino-6-(5-phosphoribosylamino)uracil reductase
VLAKRGITRLMLEGGPGLAASLVASDLVDEAILFHSPQIVGADGIDALDGMPLAALTERLKLAMDEPVGADRSATYERR